MRFNPRRIKVGLELTSKCNLRCGMCPLPVLRRPYEDMEWPIVEKAEREIHGLGLKLKWLHEMGEPLLYSRIDDAIPANTTYLPGSLSVVSSPGGIAGTKTDPADLDQAEYDAGPNEVRFRIGTGATKLNGGDPVHNPDGGGVIAPNESFSVRFSVVVGASVPDGTQILFTRTGPEGWPADFLSTGAAAYIIS